MSAEKLTTDENDEGSSQYDDNSYKKQKISRSGSNSNASSNSNSNSNSNSALNLNYNTQAYNNTSKIRNNPLANTDLDDNSDLLIQKNFIPPEVLYRLKNFSLFSDAPNSFFIELAKCLRLVQYRPQEYIVKYGEPAKSMYWILRGTVGVTSTDGESIYAELAAGSFFGEIGILFNRPRTATVVARTKVLLGILTKDALSSVLANFPKIERIIRDEGQERLAMQEKRKQLSKVSIPSINKKVSIISHPFNSRNNNDDSNQSQDIKWESNNENITNDSNDINSNDNTNGSTNRKPKTSNYKAGNNATYTSNDITNFYHNTTLPPIYLSEEPLLNSSLVANHHDQVPGPVLPPVSTFFNMVRDCNNKINQNIHHIHNSIDSIDSSISIRDFLNSLPIFKILPNKIMHELALDVEIVKFRPMEYIFKEGDFGREIFFIVYGEVEVINKIEVLARLGPMNYFGEFAFLANLNDQPLKPRSADIRAITDCEILMIKASTLDKICEKYPLIFQEFKNTANKRNKKNCNDNGLFKTFNFNKNANNHNNTGTNYSTRDNKTNSDDSSNQKPISLDLIRSPSPNLFTNNGINKSNIFESSLSPDQELDSPTTQTVSSYVIERTQSDSNVNNNSIFRNFSFGQTNGVKSNNSNDNNDGDIDNDTNPSNNMIDIPMKRWNSEILTMPPLNPIHGSVQNFSNIQKSSFQYTPLEFRRRLSNINKNRRRSSVLNIGPFPDSIFLKIFQFLDLKTIIKCIRVCLRWKQLIYLSNTLFNRLDLSPYCKEINDEILMKITTLVGNRPKFINISNCYHITDEGFSFMINEIGIRGNIEEIIMKNNWNLSAMALMDLSVSCRSLKKLDLSNCRKVKDDVIIRLLGYQNDYLFGCNQLNDLKLGYCKYLTDKTMYHISNNANERLISLDLTRCTTITDFGFVNWYNKYFFKLKRLILKDCTFLSDKVIEIISKSCINLEILDLTFCCMLTDNALRILGNECKKLTNLNLSFCGAAVSDYSLIHLRNLENLNYLSIKGCVRVTREGVDMLLTGITNIKEINLLQCPTVNVFQGLNVEPFEKAEGCNYSILKIKPHGKIVKIFL